MQDDEFSFKFPDLDFGTFTDGEPAKHPDMARSTLGKINEYLDKDIEDQLLLLDRLREFEQRLDRAFL